MPTSAVGLGCDDERQQIDDRVNCGHEHGREANNDAGDRTAQQVSGGLARLTHTGGVPQVFLGDYAGDDGLFTRVVEGGNDGGERNRDHQNVNVGDVENEVEKNRYPGQ